MQPPAAPYGSPPYWAPPRRSPQNPVAIAVVAVVLVIVLVLFLAMFALLGSGGSSFAFMFGPFCAIFLVIIVVMIAAALSGTRRTYLPPPPPVQQPMVPAGTQGPIALNCPNCGAPPVNIDRFGVATCTYCGTRFIVR